MTDVNNLYLERKITDTLISITRVTDDDFKGGREGLLDRIRSKEGSDSGNITSFLFNLEITSKLGAFFKTGKLVLKEQKNLREFLPIIGSEVISITYNNSLGQMHNFIKETQTELFSIVNVEEMHDPSTGVKEDLENRLIVLYLVEFPIYSYLTNNTIYKTYDWSEQTNKSVLKPSEILKDSFKLLEGFNDWFDLERIRETKPVFNNFYIPNWCLLDLVKYLNKYSIASTGQCSGCGNYIFNIIDPNKGIDSKPQVVYEPINDYFKESGENKRKYHLTSPDVLSDFDKIALEDIKKDMCDYINDISVNYVNVLKSSFSRMSGNTHVTMDYQEDNNYMSTEFYDFVKKDYKHLNKTTLHLRNYGNQYSKYKANPRSNKDEIEFRDWNQYSKDLMDGGITIKVDTFVNVNRVIGEKAFIEVPAKLSDQIAIPIDMSLTGDYITYEITDIISATESKSIVTFISDSFGPMFPVLHDQLAGELERNTI